jgi:hypothetical protein
MDENGLKINVKLNMKPFLLPLLFCVLSFNSFGQVRDSIRSKVNASIRSDSLAYAEGVEEARNHSGLFIRSAGDPGHVTSCEYYSYERYGVKLQMTGDLILDESIFAYNAGFNSIMQKRILDSIPQWKDSIGIIDTSWIEIDYESMLEFIGLFDYEFLTDT